MTIKIEQLNMEDIDLYCTIPINFTTDYYLKPVLEDHGLGGIKFIEESLDKPLHKNYEEDPAQWAKNFDTSNWVIFVAKDGRGTVLGGATVAYNTKGVNMLEGRDDLAVLWDIRVSHEARGKGVGRDLFAAVVNWAKDKGCTQIKVETQNNNPVACKFYVSQGCRLGGLNRFAYITEPECAHEVMLLWYMDLQ